VCKIFELVEVLSLENKSTPNVKKLLKPLTFMLCLVPLAVLGWNAYTENLSANPIDDITDTTGTWTLRFVMITSRATVREEQGAGVHIKVTASKHAKCERCWHYRADVGKDGLCARCESNLRGPGEIRAHA